ncbi:MAG: cell division protein ZapA [Deltaproteobacteria bacterium]|nr:cell division protein ZapA [Deltaproteobacteria bacterium]
MSAKTTTATEVEIFGSVYHVRGEKNPEYLHSLAEMVDRKMREIGQHVSTVDTSKIAILAALNLADELVQSRTEQEGERAEIEAKVTVLAGELDEALKQG